MLLTKDKDDLQLIERFFERELTEQDLADFEVRLKEDNDFAERVDRFGYAHKKVEEIYYPNERKAFKQKWTKVLTTDEEAPPQNVKSMRYYLMRVAAVILLIIGLALVFNQFSPSNNNFQQLALQNWEQSTMTISTRDKTQVVQSTVIWDKAEKAYKEGKFEEALGFLDILGDEPDALLWKGNCYFELRQMPKAISHFEAVIQHKDSDKKDPALWYQALAYLYKKDTDATRKNLNLIIEGNYPKARDAKQLLKQL